MIKKGDGERRPYVVLLNEFQRLRFNHHLTISTAKLAENAESHMSNLIAGVAECAPQRLHQLCTHWLNMFIKKVRLQVVHAKFERAQALRDQGLAAVEGRDQWVHQHGQIGQQ